MDLPLPFGFKGGKTESAAWAAVQNASINADDRQSDGPLGCELAGWNRWGIATMGGNVDPAG